MAFLYVNPRDIVADEQGIRQDQGDIAGLAQTIAMHGMLQPIGIQQMPDGSYKVVYGGRRLAAALELDMPVVPCIDVGSLDENALLLAQITENYQRLDMTDWEKANALHRLRVQLRSSRPDWTESEIDEEAGQSLGVTGRSVRRYLCILDLPVSIQSMVHDRDLTLSHAQHLYRIRTHKAVEPLAQVASEQGWSAGQVATMATYLAGHPNTTLEEMQEALGQGTDVAVADTRPVVEEATKPIAQPRQSDTADDDSSAENRGDPMRDEAIIAGDPTDNTRTLKYHSLGEMTQDSERMARSIRDGDLSTWVRSDRVPASALLSQLQYVVEQLRSALDDEHDA